MILSIFVLGVLVGISVSIVVSSFRNVYRRRVEPPSCGICGCLLSTGQILYGDGTCSKACSGMASGAPMPWEGWNYPDPEEYAMRTRRRNRPVVEEQ